MGPVRSTRAVPSLLARRPAVFAVAGVAGALTDALTPGDIVVASEIRSAGGAEPVPTTDASGLAGLLRSAGLSVQIGPIVSADHLVRGQERAELAASGALAVDMESAELVGAADGVPFAVLRVVVDTPARPLFHPATPIGGLSALRTLAKVGSALCDWASMTVPETIRNTFPKEVRP
jgi:4-hydroxy-3-methylbut-2-enyl diphosphate reductase